MWRGWLSDLWRIYLVVQTFSLLTLVSAALSCESGWLEFNGNCYGIFVNQTKPTSFNTAVKFCKDRNSEIVLVENEAENAFIRANAYKLYYKARMFVGVQDYWTEGTFRTMYGDLATYENFAGIDPDDGSSKYIRENCVFLFAKSGIWKDQKCVNNTKVDTYTCQKGLKKRSLTKMTIEGGFRLDQKECQLNSYTVSSRLECGVKYLNSEVALSFNVARNMEVTSPNCHLMKCTPADVTTLNSDPNWILYHYPEIY